MVKILPGGKNEIYVIFQKQRNNRKYLSILLFTFKICWTCRDSSENINGAK